MSGSSSLEGRTAADWFAVLGDALEAGDRGGQQLWSLYDSAIAAMPIEPNRKKAAYAQMYIEYARLSHMCAPRRRLAAASPPPHRQRQDRAAGGRCARHVRDDED